MLELDGGKADGMCSLSRGNIMALFLSDLHVHVQCILCYTIVRLYMHMCVHVHVHVTRSTCTCSYM